jgi:hypothetical protein
LIGKTQKLSKFPLLILWLNRGFLFYVEKGFRDRNLRTDVLLLPPRVNMQAAIRRQILEGVQAVVKLQRASYYSGKIPLHVFDRTGGADNVRFDGKPDCARCLSKWSLTLNFTEYSDLALEAAAELVLRAKQAQAAAPPISYPAAQPYGPQYPPNAAQPLQSPSEGQAPGAPNISSLISNLDASGLQRLLGALQQPSQQAQPQQPPPIQHAALPAPSSGTGTTDLAGLLSTVARQQQDQAQNYPQPSYSQGPAQQQPPVNPYGGLVSNPAFANNPVLNSLFTGNPQQPAQQGPNSQTYMNPSGRWK